MQQLFRGAHSRRNLYRMDSVTVMILDSESQLKILEDEREGGGRERERDLAPRESIKRVDFRC